MVERPITLTVLLLDMLKVLMMIVSFFAWKLRHSYEDNDKNLLREKRKHISCSTENDSDHDDDLNNLLWH